MRPLDSEALRGFPRAWACRALWEYQGDLKALNAQLALKPDPDHPFEAGAWPRPYYPQEAADPFFDGALAGRSPDRWEWINRDDPATCFNLFLRVAQHLPGSEDWLFRDLHLYVRRSLPPIDVAIDLLEVCLGRLGLRILPEPALATVLRLEPDRGRQIAQQGLDRLSWAGDPIHLTTLLVLWHVAHWKHPFSEYAGELHLAASVALNRFVERAEFEIDELTHTASKRVYHALCDVRRTIKYEGFRIPLSNQRRPDIGLSPILVRDFPNRDAAIDCASLGTAVPLHHFVDAEPAPYREDVVPSSQELRTVTDLILNAAEWETTHLLSYARDPEVLAELSQSQARPAISKRRRSGPRAVG